MCTISGVGSNHDESDKSKDKESPDDSDVEMVMPQLQKKDSFIYNFIVRSLMISHRLIIFFPRQSTGTAEANGSDRWHIITDRKRRVTSIE